MFSCVEEKHSEEIILLQYELVIKTPLTSSAPTQKKSMKLLVAPGVTIGQPKFYCVVLGSYLVFRPWILPLDALVQKLMKCVVEAMHSLYTLDPSNQPCGSTNNFVEGVWFVVL